MKDSKRIKKPRAVPCSPETEHAISRIGEIASLPPEERSAAVHDGVGVITTLSPHDVKQVLVEAARSNQMAVVPLIEALLDDPEYAVPAAEALGHVRSEEVVPLLQSMDSPDRSKALVKASRRALHRLKSQGIAVKETAPSSPSEISLVGGRRIIRSMMTQVSSKGEQFLLVLVSSAFAGSESIQVLVSDTDGITETAAAPVTKIQFDDYLSSTKETQMILIDAPADYVLHRVRSHEAIARGKNTPFPYKYQIYRDVFCMSRREYERALVYEMIDLETVVSDPSLADRAHELFEFPEFGRWFLPEEQIEPFAVRAIEMEQSPLVLSEAAEAERSRRIVDDAIQEIFTPEVRALYKRRIEENAGILALTDRMDLAHIAVACALRLSPDGTPTGQVAFIEHLVERSIALFIEDEREEPRIHRV